jgi:hypothetical protein
MACRMNTLPTRADFEAAYRERTEEASRATDQVISELLAIMIDSDAPKADRIAAADAILGWMGEKHHALHSHGL